MQRKTHGAGRLLAGFSFALLIAAHANAQGYPGGRPGNTGSIVPHSGIGEDEPNHAVDPKPEQAAKKALSAGLKSLARAKDLESQAAAAAGNPDKRGKLLEKASDSYNKALDQFTEALANKSDLVDAWNNVGLVHLKLGAYREAVDDYNHALALKPDLSEAEAHRAEALLALDHLEDARAAYMDLYAHAPPLAQELMSAMQRWLQAHRDDPQGIRAKDIESFRQWVEEREVIAQQAAVARDTPSSP